VQKAEQRSVGVGEAPQKTQRFMIGPDIKADFESEQAFEHAA